MFTWKGKNVYCSTNKCDHLTLAPDCMQDTESWVLVGIFGSHAAMIDFFSKEEMKLLKK